MTASGRRPQFDTGAILHRRDFRETSQLLELFTREHGRIALVARGARRPRRGAANVLQPFAILLVGWSQRGELGTLHSAEPVETGPGPLQGDALASAFYANELLMRLLHRFDPHPRLFDAYRALLFGLGDRAGRETVLRLFEKRLLEETGYGLVLDHDVVTGRGVRADSLYSYSPEHGPEEVDPAQRVAGLPVVHGRTLLALADESLGDAGVLREAKRLMRFMVDHHLGGRPLASRALLRRGR